MTSRGSDKPPSKRAGTIVDVSLYVHRYGLPEPAQLLAVHGLTGHGQRWQTLATRYLPQFAVAAPDLIGHGRSTWAAPWTLDANTDALAALLDADGGGPVVVVGHSFGGAVALALASARPDLVSGLVLLDPAVSLDGEWMRETADDMLASPDYTDRAEARAEKVSGSWGEVDSAELDRELDEHLVTLSNGRSGWRISVPAMMSYWSELARPVTLPRDGTPTTLIRATRTDPPYATDELIASLDAALGSNLTVLQWDCDHMVGQAKPAESAAVVREHLERR
ncbi:alpha/beta hydrolase [Mycolicibacterium doricum]|uniref:Alpha/beta hydrolase n=1 Tax=Mycolicibacterium doricum TaxID=126673 RepID=A0A1X1TBL8_9MYCO|nr:alpha/beta hydrolase [Mycolicibacterium doricum]MCV7267491.1 alpha/beta hydrolase [Mycolicibacterium doricum]ORV41981.1 alpha/beta hydrolase [Mycolicibacterium doricum]BBZ06797.1 alpha/beta hydrolase [Mycolicibacterium doricum]